VLSLLIPLLSELQGVSFGLKLRRGERELDFLLVLIGYYAFSLVTMFADMANLVKIDMSLTALSSKFILIKISFNTSLLEFI